MKKILIVVLLLTSSPALFAQLDLKKATGVASALGMDPAAVGKSIMGSLTPKLGLSSDQTTKVASLVNTFLTNKSTFMGLMQSKPAEYKTKFATEQKTLMDGLKGTLNIAQLTKFTGLKPAQTDTTNALSQLFY
jgi:hypothetical protein